jgi:hypothetical protein
LQEENVVLGFGGVLGVFPVNVDAVEAEVFDQLDRRLGEFLAASGGGGRGGEVGGVGPAADGEENFEGTVAGFEDVELFKTAVEVGASVVPGVTFEVDVGVCPPVC